MAKKKKQKKAGIEKRRKNKLQRRTAIKKKVIAQQPVQKKISPAKLKQNLKNIPSLIFEPEIQELAFSADQMNEAQVQHEKVPDQIEALATDEFTEKLKSQLEIMKERFEKQGDANKSMMAHAIIYFMEQESAPSFLNQIIVAMYYDAQNKVDQKEPLNIKQLNSLLRNYDKEWETYLREKADTMTSLEEAGQLLSDDFEDSDEDDTETEPTEMEAVIEEFMTYLETEQSMEEEQRERIQEDVEVLVLDYFQEKEINDLEAVRPRKIKSFLESWFINTMHPTKDDMGAMVDSLSAFTNFLIQKEKISPEKGNEIMEIFADKEAILSNMNI